MKKCKINKGIFLGLVLAISLPFVFVSCAGTQAATEMITTQTTESAINNVPPLNDGTTSIQIEFTYDQLLNQKHITQTIEVALPGSLIVILGSNRTTGYQWRENAVIGDLVILNQYSHQFVEPQTVMMGVAGKEVFVFKTLVNGISTIQLQYSRPWESSEQSEWTVDLIVVVK
jgi:predicted secreted protein